MTENWETVLKHELGHEDEGNGGGSFLLRLRCDLEWDRAAFTRLIDAMQSCAKAHEGCDTLPRWIAEGFWFVSYFVKEWSSHPDFAKSFNNAYYEAAYERLGDLAYWLFHGESPYLATHVWLPL